ncbi:hypothetical protein BD311DRAFT_411540 [Dichomitus squalens]|uniref:Uncharacterized protein n=1 Tax=Dichomitus squalens TaxID=114155 RepID=A0A4Q9MHZ3_9APHY|nr:hypothetical protein BD311DRAFT_411540 [Dichomitus squalens]
MEMSVDSHGLGRLSLQIDLVWCVVWDPAVWEVAVKVGDEGSGRRARRRRVMSAIAAEASVWALSTSERRTLIGSASSPSHATTTTRPVETTVDGSLQTWFTRGTQEDAIGVSFTDERSAIFAATPEGDNIFDTVPQLVKRQEWLSAMHEL